MSSLPSARWGGGTINARLILSRSTGDNHAAFSSLLAEADVDAALILGKVTGGEGHGGGAVVPAGSALYVSLERYLELLEDGLRRLKREVPWAGTATELPENTLRRATLLFSGRVTTQSEFNVHEQAMQHSGRKFCLPWRVRASRGSWSRERTIDSNIGSRQRHRFQYFDV